VKRNPRLRKIIREKSEGFCAECGQYDAKGECDHILPLFLGGQDRLENLRWLCRRCHLEKSIGETPVRAKSDRLRLRHELTKRRRAIDPDRAQKQRRTP